MYQTDMQKDSLVPASNMWGTAVSLCLIKFKLNINFQKIPENSKKKYFFVLI